MGKGHNRQFKEKYEWPLSVKRCSICPKRNAKWNFTETACIVINSAIYGVPLFPPSYLLGHWDGETSSGQWAVSRNDACNSKAFNCCHWNPPGLTMFQMVTATLGIQGTGMSQPPSSPFTLHLVYYNLHVLQAG